MYDTSESLPPTFSEKITFKYNTGKRAQEVGRWRLLEKKPIILLKFKVLLKHNVKTRIGIRFLELRS